MNPTSLRTTLLVLLFSAIAGALHAQDLDTVKTWSAEEFAQKMTDQMTTRVPLRPDQIEPVSRINLKFAERAMPVVKGAGDQKSKIAAVKKFDHERNEELELFLDSEQLRQVKQLQYENRKKMKQRYHERH
ncbi:MAG: hypothetical protein ABI432_01570 [Flavobacteriales bacterium]